MYVKGQCNIITQNSLLKIFASDKCIMKSGFLLQYSLPLLKQIGWQEYPFTYIYKRLNDNFTSTEQGAGEVFSNDVLTCYKYMK